MIPAVLSALPLYWLVLRREAARNLFVVLFSLGAIATLHPVFALCALALTLAAHQIVEAKRAGSLSGGRTVLLITTIAIATIGVGKYGRSFAIAIWGESDWVLTHLVMPLGTSYFVFRLLQYVFDQVRGILNDNSFLELAAFVLFLPTFPAGPIETFQSFYAGRSRDFDYGLFCAGLRRIALGYFKKLFVVDFIIKGMLFGNFLAALDAPNFTWDGRPPLQPLGYVIICFVQAYFDLSAYSDLAIGFSSLFGFRIMENFDYPFWKRNLAEFWRSWHISLSSWCRNNVYFPIFGLTRKPWLGLYASMLTMGVWHYVSLNWFVWGLYHGSGLVVVSLWDKYQRSRRKGRKMASKPAPAYEKFTAWLGYPMTFLYVALGYSFVSTRTFGSGLTIFVRSLFGPIVWVSSFLS